MKDVKFLPSEKSITQQKSLVRDFKVRKVKDTRRSVVPRRKICKLYKGNINSDSRSYINNFSTNVKKMLLLKAIRTFHKEVWMVKSSSQIYRDVVME